MLSRIKCQKCEGNMKLQYDPFGSYFLCVMCGSEIGAACPHCDTASIIVRPSRTGTEVICKVCGCGNGELAQKVCTKNREPGIIMV